MKKTNTILIILRSIFFMILSYLCIMFVTWGEYWDISSWTPFDRMFFLLLGVAAVWINYIFTIKNN